MNKKNSKSTGIKSESKVPSDLRRILATNPTAKTQWADLTPIGRRDFIGWIDSAKQLETRKRRVDSVPSRLASGKRRPCCYAIVPMNLYKALGSDSKAKTGWSGLTPDERRNFIDWINSAKESEERGVRIVKACAMLTAGKRRP